MALHLEIVTPKGSVADEDVAEVRVPGKLGEFGVLEGHLPILSALRAGILSFRSDKGEKKIALGGRGFAEVGAGDKVLVLTDNSAWPEEVDLTQVKQELAEAEAELEACEEGPDSAEHKLFRSQIAWARARIDLKERPK